MQVPGSTTLQRVGPLEGGEGAQLAVPTLRRLHKSPHQTQVLREGHCHFVHFVARVVHEVKEVGAADLQLPAQRTHSVVTEPGYQRLGALQLAPLLKDLRDNLATFVTFSTLFEPIKFHGYCSL